VISSPVFGISSFQAFYFSSFSSPHPAFSILHTFDIASANYLGGSFVEI